MIFLDTNYIVSYYVEKEKHHKRSLEIAEIIEDREQIISRLVIGETINILEQKLKLDRNFIKKIYEELFSNYTVIEDHYFYDKALNNVLNSKKRFPFFDHIYIVLMGELNISEIVSFDKHFNNQKGIKRVH
ncbi:MAG: PIN domain-containing protein [Methanobrevibacter sp.]|jgi:predicted nucleic acid-binding protein|nr:PIN domain-containing protein [Candidatus Methanovirga procula]